MNTQYNPYTPTILESRRKEVIDELLNVPACRRTQGDRQLLTAQLGSG